MRYFAFYSTCDIFLTTGLAGITQDLVTWLVFGALSGVNMVDIEQGNLWGFYSGIYLSNFAEYR